MTYSIGAVHTLTGKGVFTANFPIGLLAVTTNVGVNSGLRVDSPPSYWGMGHLRPGNTDGWGRTHKLETIATLIYPLNDMVTRVGYTLPLGVETTVTELLGPAVPNWQKQPWDRAAAALHLHAISQPTSPTNTTLWSYTVPAGRMLWVASGELTISRYSVDTTPNEWDLNMFRGSVNLAEIRSYVNVIPWRERAEISLAPLILLPGEILSAKIFSNAAGGIHTLTATASGFTFDV